MQIATWLQRIGVAMAAALAATGFAPVQAQQPTLKFMIPANPGGGWDQTGRNLALAMQDARLISGAQFENKGGAAGTIGLAQFANSTKGDPNALMIGGIAMVGGIILNDAPVDLPKVTPIARLTNDWEVVVVPANSPLKNLNDLVNLLKENPGKVSWGGGSAASTDHILVGLIARAVGVDPAKVNYVAFKGGGEAVAAIIGGHVTAGVSGVGEFSEHIKSGKMRALAQSSPATVDGIPSLKEQGVDVVLANWRGVFAAPGITTQQRDGLIKMVKQATETPVWKSTLERMGWTPVFLPGDQFATFVSEENKRITAIFKDLRLKK
jgi:putative tricarboxylic transport membrane protein